MTTFFQFRLRFICLIFQMDTAEDTPDTAKATERLMLSTDCEFVTFMSVVKGKFELTTSYCYFFDTSPYKVSCHFWSSGSLACKAKDYI